MVEASLIGVLISLVLTDMPAPLILQARFVIWDSGMSTRLRYLVCAMVKAQILEYANPNFLHSVRVEI